MPKYQYIKVTLSEMAGSDCNIIYNYPAEDPRDPDAAFNGTEALHEFVHLKECYALWSTVQGHYFALVSPNPSVANGSAMVLTVRLDNECALSGKRIVALLAELRKTLVEGRNLIGSAVERAFEAVGVPEEPEKLQSWQYEKPLISDSAPKRPLCYRTYASSSELDAILSFPSQVEYACYDRVLAVQATASLRPGSRMDRITARLKRVYTVIPSPGCTPSRTVVADGERLSLTFTKPGFNPRTENISAGAPSPYVKYDGPAIRVKTPAESGLGFVRRVPLVVLSAKGHTVQGFTINVNGRPINTMDPFIEITERDLSPSAKTEIQVASNNYKPLKVVKTAAELINSDKLELTLEPIEQGITLRLDFGDGRIFSEEITLEKNTPEYSQLHSGNFHGFRAHRLTVAGTAEVYNVDMKSPTRPAVAATAQSHPAGAPATASPAGNPAVQEPQPQRKPVPPVFGKDTPETRRAQQEERQRRREDAAAEKQRREQAAKEAAEEKAFAPETRSNKGLWGLVALVALVLIGAIIFFLLPPSKAKTFEPEVVADTMPAGEAGEAAPVVAAAPAAGADELHDAAYLNDNRYTWRTDSLRSESYRALMASLAEGDIEAIVAHPYFTNDKALTNATARSIADMMWAAKGSPNDSSNRKAIKKNVKNGVVQVYEMYEALARVKPAEPNTAPRPVK